MIFIFIDSGVRVIFDGFATTAPEKLAWIRPAGREGGTPRCGGAWKFVSKRKKTWRFARKKKNYRQKSLNPSDVLSVLRGPGPDLSEPTLVTTSRLIFGLSKPPNPRRTSRPGLWSEGGGHKGLWNRWQPKKWWPSTYLFFCMSITFSVWIHVMYLCNIHTNIYIIRIKLFDEEIKKFHFNIVGKTLHPTHKCRCPKVIQDPRPITLLIRACIQYILRILEVTLLEQCLLRRYLLYWWTRQAKPRRKSI